MKGLNEYGQKHSEQLLGLIKAIRAEREQAEKDKTIGKDELERSKKQIDEQVAKQKTQVEELARAKEQEILTV